MIAWLLLLAAIAALVAGTVILWHVDTSATPRAEREGSAAAATGTATAERANPRAKRRVRTPPPTANAGYYRRQLPERRREPRTRARDDANPRVRPASRTDGSAAASPSTRPE